ncbi:hypothetical protein CEXT_192941 [Caerostris extrusa]|uniref:Uncharacterized protein n=1 Tax=Caerostris extrusa TaxID=172846 RepID=A0AAV4R651_CAEEX|nr:hypothetical protein CEXT_192941 [Caerostris extrusa]
MARTLSGKKRPKASQRHSAGNMEQQEETYDNLDQNFHTPRSKTVTDGMDDMDASERSDSDHPHHHRGQGLQLHWERGAGVCASGSRQGRVARLEAEGEGDRSATLPHPVKAHFDGNAPSTRRTTAPPQDSASLLSSVNVCRHHCLCNFREKNSTNCNLSQLERTG